MFITCGSSAAADELDWKWVWDETEILLTFQPLLAPFLPFLGLGSGTSNELASESEHSMTFSTGFLPFPFPLPLLAPFLRFLGLGSGTHDSESEFDAVHPSELSFSTEFWYSWGSLSCGKSPAAESHSIWRLSIEDFWKKETRFLKQCFSKRTARSSQLSSRLFWDPIKMWI